MSLFPRKKLLHAVSNIGIISFGGPGSMMHARPSRSMMTPGAVPLSFWSTIAPEGTVACLRMLVLSGVPRRAARSSSRRRASGSSVGVQPK